MRFKEFLAIYESLDPELRRNRKEMIKYFSRLDKYSDWNAEHAMNVTKMARDFGKHLGLDSNRIVYSAFAHDVGKTRIPKDILHKEGPLDKEEREVMDTHAIHSRDLLNKMSGDIGFIARSGANLHHTKATDLDKMVNDGKLSEEDAVILKVLMIVDIFDGVTDPKRPYRKPPNPPELKVEDALELLPTIPAVDKELAHKFVKWHIQTYANRSRN